MSWNLNDVESPDHIRCPVRTNSSSSEESSDRGAISDTKGKRKYVTSDKKVQWAPCTRDNEHLSRQSFQDPCVHPKVFTSRHNGRPEGTHEGAE